MKSMTGYGKAEYKEDDIDLIIELKTVNNRYLDINMKYPKTFTSLEDGIRNIIKANLSRGRVDVFINYSNLREKNKNLNLNLTLAKSYIEACSKIQNLASYKLQNLNVGDVIRFSDVLNIEETEEEDIQSLKEILNFTLIKALDNLNEMRKQEGLKLKEDMINRLDAIAKEVETITARAPKVAENYREKIYNRISELLKDVKVDETRLLNEVAVYSDKSNIDEELTRLNSHIIQFSKICEEDAPGKKLDFLIQEFNREANTICSKSNDIEVTNSGLNLKCEIEKIREQIQNIE